MMPFSFVCRRLLLVTAAALVVPALADDRPPMAGAGAQSAQPAAPSGERRFTGTASVSRLLELQRSGQAASPHPQHVSGEVQARIYRRYLESFTHPIPERYIDIGFGGD